jgi:hypothetical protein
MNRQHGAKARFIFQVSTEFHESVWAPGNAMLVQGAQRAGFTCARLHSRRRMEKFGLELQERIRIKRFRSSWKLDLIRHHVIDADCRCGRSVMGHAEVVLFLLGNQD